MAGPKAIGQRMRDLRTSAGMSQPQLARAAGIPVASLRNWEQGRRAPLLDTAARLAKALKVSLDAFMQTAHESEGGKTKKRAKKK